MSKQRSLVKRIILLLLSIVIGIIGVMAITFYIAFTKSVPQTSGELELEGLLTEVNIRYDKMGLPRIYADNENDAYFALGYQHAADRMFQMDIARRAAGGRLSEVLGATALETDIRQRRIGHNRIARDAEPRLHQRDSIRLAAYANGVNAYAMNCGSLPFEYRFLPIRFEAWTVHDCLTLLSFQTWYSDALQNRDELFVELTELLGPEGAILFDLPYPDWAPTTVPEIVSISLLDSQFQIDSPESKLDATSKASGFEKRTPKGVAERIIGDGLRPFAMTTSSNAFVIAPGKSKSGKAMLASDPHLEIGRLPQFWYYVGINATDVNLDAVGITTAGLPFVVMGHNGRAAWAFTAGGIDVTDYYRETINPDDSSLYQTPDGWAQLEQIEERIRIAGEDSTYSVVVQKTHHGPLTKFNKETGEVYAFRWAGYDKDLAVAVSAAFGLAEIADYDSFRSAVTSFGALDANWFYADVDGNIGYQLGTPVPVRPEPWPNLPIDGATSSMQWREFLPLDATPHALNPEQGWLASSNNAPRRDLKGNFAADRILRLSELLSASDKLSVADLQSMQMDITDQYLMRWKDVAATTLGNIGEQDRANQIRAWDGSTDQDSWETHFILLFLSELSTATFSDELPEHGGAIRKVWLDQIYFSNDEHWFDNSGTPEIESREDISQLAARNALEIAGDRTWGEVNSFTMYHPMAGIPLISDMLGLQRGPWPIGGTAGTLKAAFFRQAENHTFQTFVGPSWRFTIDFADIDRAEIVLPAGNSGNPASDHFFDFYPMYLSGERWNVPLTEAKVKELSVEVLTLKPMSEKPIEE